MDSNDPNNPNSVPGSTPTQTPVDPASSWPSTEAPANPQPQDFGTSQYPPQAASITPTPTSPWEPAPSSNGPTSEPTSPTPSPGFPTNPAAQPTAPAATPLPESPWNTTPVTEASDVPVAPAAPPISNPFLQTPNAVNFSNPQPMDQYPTPAVPPPGTDPLNTAFNPTNQPAQDTFASLAPSLPEAAQPTAPSLPQPSMGQAATPTQNPPASNQSGPNILQSAPLDLSALQSSPGANPTPEGNGASPDQQTPHNPPQMSPTENAPTDLSHLIAGDEQPTQPMGNVYTPPVAPDQNPTVSTPQTQPENQTPPPGKHLNLTKVLLVAGIPIILIVAALSAYLILGIGKSSTQSSEDTSLPVEQKDTQAPLTNPPQQIVAPSPATIPEPSVQALPAGPTPSAPASPSSAMEKLKARQSSPSPAASSSSESLPTN